MNLFRLLVQWVFVGSWMPSAMAFWASPTPSNRFRLLLRQTDDKRMQLQLSPLIGGPKWLSVHCKLILSSGDDGVEHTFDFVPEQATEPATLVRLLTLQDVPGMIRYQSRAVEGYKLEDEDDMDPALATALDFCMSYQPAALHLVNNNCYTFAARLYQNVTKTIFE